MGSSCSSAQKKKDKNKGGLTVPDEQRRQSVLSTDSLPYGKGSPPGERKKSDGTTATRSGVKGNYGGTSNNVGGGANASEEAHRAARPETGTTEHTASSSPSGVTITPNSAIIGDGTPRFRGTVSPEAQGLPNLQQFPSSVLDLLMGKVRDATVATSVREISIYVCAGYKDTEVEREALTERVFPDLRLHCAQRGYELRFVDLHWGHIGPYLDEHGYRFICLNTLQELKDRGAPLILLLLNDGSEQLTLPPRRVSAGDFEQALEALAEEDQEGRGTLLKWYGKDDNAVPVSGQGGPVYVLRPIRNHLPNIVSNFEDERQEARDTWAAESRAIVLTLKKVFTEEQRATYFSSVLEDEISKSVLDDPKMSKRCLWFQRTFTHYHVVHPAQSVEEDDSETAGGEGESPAASTPVITPATSVLDQVDANRVSLMKVRLQEQLPDNQKIVFKVKWRKGNKVFPEEFEDHQQYVNDLSARAALELKKLIDGMIEEDFLEEAKQTYRGIETSLYDELQRQTTFCKIGAATFFHQAELLVTLKNYIVGDDKSPLILHAPAGGGKTALLCTVATRCCDWIPDAPVVFRLVGATPDSMTQEQLLRSVCEQCCALYGEHPSMAFKRLSDPENSSEDPLNVLLSKVNSRRPLVLLIDGLDRIAPYSSRGTHWLPKQLPPHVRLILTVRDDTEELKALKDWLGSDHCFVPIPSLGPVKYADLVDNIVHRNQRSLTASHKEAVLKCLAIATPTPRYAYLIGHRVLDWWSDEEPDLSTIPSTTPEMVHETMAYLEGHLGPEVAAFIVGFLAASRYGLTEAELLDLLSLQEAVLERVLAHDPRCKPRRCPYMIWGVAKKRMKPLLRSTTVGKRTMVTWRCDAYRTLCQKRVGEDTWEECLRGLAAYFEGDTAEAKGLVLEQPTRFGSWPNRRKADELPFIYFQMGETLRERFALDMDWLKLKVAAADPYCLLEDIEMCRRQLDVDEEEEIRELDALTVALGKASYALRYDGSQLTSQLYTRLKSLAEKEEAAEDYPLLLNLFKQASRPMEPALLPVNLESVGALVNSPSTPTTEDSSFAALHTMKGNPFYLISMATKNGQVTVWDVYREKPTRTLTGVFEPKDVQMIDSTRALVLCNRELKVYNLDAGCLVTKLKGVMNQKMAYYGLHDENYVVALSRNRMYVNMMNLRTGDLETTFKVGEDRFLNSLLVSANGRICVCGDETQKPFPLLVWDLANRKLLYDLRIPHHEFLTRMSAISHDGHYVVCVCRELDDGSPNFIIVYDLQSGTLFKKWKPESNSSSIAISSPGGCVINGLENTLVLVWDLVTGARRYNLQGHTAPVDEIKLDDDGGRCLTYDSAGRDRSVRVWDLAKGECLAVLTPDLPISCAQLTLDGRAVVLGLKRVSRIVTYLLCQDGRSPEEALPEREPYGDADNDGKNFDVSQQG